MTKVNHELSIDELGVISGGGLKSAFDKVPASTATSGTGAPDWWKPFPGYLTMDSIRALGPIGF
ncbi:hypothetical protein [Bradyrhizobium sp. AUGA SZCCT0160]|uniref:hypothetical protein n=1 Tax=Bradyrhizobium sp. AUGA SZCCT0160 TaxID=2807662 RepID=UPI001BABD302|nr:hypothetical protein [Bradyrhizobium sp. AUGA SZCCT0160]MBR1187696.1 hypothetical protein [Bradyrhizobium sp. AUGA SZCCT0160]